MSTKATRDLYEALTGKPAGRKGETRLLAEIALAEEKARQTGKRCAVDAQMTGDYFLRVIHDFRVYGYPRPQPRPRARNGGPVYNPNSADHWKALVLHTAGLVRGEAPPIDYPVRVDMDFYFKTPKKWSATVLAKLVAWYGSAAAIPRGAPVIYPSVPDLDNLMKAPLDAFQSVDALASATRDALSIDCPGSTPILADDCLVVDSRVRKFYHPTNVQGARIRISRRIVRNTDGDLS